MLLRKPKKNFLDMIPVRNIGEFTREGDKITLMIPKFKSEWMRKWLIPASHSRYFRIHLDETGSKVWLLIDGTRNTDEICNLLSNSVSDQIKADDSVALRVTEFLRQLYRNRFIVFK